MIVKATHSNAAEPLNTCGYRSSKYNMLSFTHQHAMTAIRVFRQEVCCAIGR